MKKNTVPVKPNGSLNFCIMGGCGSSGTTLLTHLLSLHQDISSGPEFNLFNHYELYEFEMFKKNHLQKLNGKCEPSGYIDSAVFMTYREHYGLTEELISNWINQADTLHDFMSNVLSHMFERFSVPFFLEKSPTNVYCFSDLVQAFPTTPIIHVVRDGRDVVCSLMKRGFNLHGAASRWLYDTMCGLSVRDAPNYFEIRYEDLVNDPDKILSDIYGFIGMDAPIDRRIDDTKHTKSVYSENWLDRDVPKIWTSTPSDPISTASIGKYKKVLSENDLDILSKVTLRDKYIRKNMPDLKNFYELLQFLGYIDSSEIKRNTSISFTNKMTLQISDYERRLSRFVSQYGMKLPRLYTFIK